MMVLFYLVFINIHFTKSMSMVNRNSVDLPLERQIQEKEFNCIRIFEYVGEIGCVQETES